MAKEKSQPLDHLLLQRLMERDGVNKSDLGKLLQLHNSTVGRWARGTHGPSGEDAIRLSRLFGVSITKLYGWPETEEETLFSRLCALPADSRKRALDRFSAWISAVESELNDPIPTAPTKA